MASIDETLRRLMEVIQRRKSANPDTSYTARLLHGGIGAIGAKVIEESREVVEAAAEDGRDRRPHVVHEAADVLYHLWVLLAACDVSCDEVAAELTRRFGTSGLEEKAARNRTPPPTTKT